MQQIIIDSKIKLVTSNDNLHTNFKQTKNLDLYKNYTIINNFNLKNESITLNNTDLIFYPLGAGFSYNSVSINSRHLFFLKYYIQNQVIEQLTTDFIYSDNFNPISNLKIANGTFSYNSNILTLNAKSEIISVNYLLIENLDIV